EDGGKTWSKVDAGLAATIVGASTTEKNEMVLADMGGRLAISSDGGRSFKPLPLAKSMMLSGVADAGNGKVALVGPRGVMVETPAAR
ncbi:MAG: WD40/YVTN/BNR-like repeat-containing protein, partial [Burkholderiaceae bacterium]